jgi:hypothetical protein
MDQARALDRSLVTSLAYSLRGPLPAGTGFSSCRDEFQSFNAKTAVER